MAGWMLPAAIVAAPAISAILGKLMGGSQGAAAPAPAVGEKEDFRMPDVFNSGGRSLLGQPKLSEELMSPQGMPPTFGPSPGSSLFDRMNMQQGVNQLAKGK